MNGKPPDYLKYLLTLSKDTVAVFATAQSGTGVGVTADLIQFAVDLLAADQGRSAEVQIAELKAQLDCVAQGLDWSVHAHQQNNQWAAINAAWMESHSVGFPRQSGYDVNSHEAALAAGGQIMFSRIWAPASTTGAWKTVFFNTTPPFLDAGLFVGVPGAGGRTNHVFDWRIAFPWFTKAIAIRLVLIARMDPQFDINGTWNNELEGTPSFPGYRVMLQQRLAKMPEAIHCSYGGGHDSTAFVCADFNTGVNTTQIMAIDASNVPSDGEPGLGRSVSPAPA